MAKRLVVLSLTSLSLVVGYPAYAERAQARADGVRVTVRIDNNAGVPDQILAFARSRTAEIFRRIGVSLTWLDSKDAIRQQVRPHYTIVLLTPEGERRKVASDGLAKNAVGQAVIASRRAYVFYQRVIATVSLPDRDIVTLLGYTMAHELGHLMLPPHSHSHAGVMRPNYHTDSRAIPSFTDAEATAIRRRLADERTR